MRMRMFSVVLSTATLALMFQCGPVLASKPAHAQERSQGHGNDGKKVDARDGRPHQDGADRRAGFSASNVRDRDDDRRQAGWQDDPRYRDRWDNDRDHDRGDDRDRDSNDDRWRHGDGDHDRDDDWRRDSRQSYEYSDSYNRYSDRYDRYYYYPRRGYIVYQLPPRYRVVRYSGVPYYFGDGSWYSPYGSGYRVISPPIGLLLSFLPDEYQTLLFGGIPYYRANDVYYRWMPQYRAYMITGLPGRY